MLLLFVVAGISARYALEKEDRKTVLKESVDKILAPSTLCVLAFGWLGGYVIHLHTARQYAGECTGFCESHYHLMLWYRGTVVLPCIVCGSTISASDPKIAGKCNAAYHVLPERHLYSGILAGYYLFSNESVMEK